MPPPQGGWEDDETLEYAAKRETVEEAGVRGTLEASSGTQLAVASPAGWLEGMYAFQCNMQLSFS